MGRWSSGAIATGGCLHFDISVFKYNLKNRIAATSGIQWKSGAVIGFTLSFDDFSAILHLNYTKTDKDETHSIRYNVTILSKPSNLGKGRIYYFVCPFSGKLCKTLYMGYGSHYFKSREAYKHRIYYPTQIRSKLDRHNYRYHDLEKIIKNLEAKHPKSHYRGKPTAIGQRIEQLKEERDYHENMRWIIVPKVIAKMVGLYRLPDARYLF